MPILERMIQWAPFMATGHPVVDEDHQKLIAALNELDAALHRGADTASVIEILSFLVGYTREHFAREEDLMRRVHCPALEENIKAHSMLLIQLSAWIPSLNEKMTTELAQEISIELSEWIQSHILRVDCKLRNCHGNPG